MAQQIKTVAIKPDKSEFDLQDLPGNKGKRTPLKVVP